MRPQRLAWKAEHIVALVDALASTDADERRAAVADLCNAFEPLVQTQALSYWRAGAVAELFDIEQTARLAVIEACQTFVPSTDARSQVARFKTHVIWRIRHALQEFVEHNHDRQLQLPQWLWRLRAREKRIRQQLTQRLKRRPTVEELAQALNEPETKVQLLRECQTPIYVDDETIGGDSPEDIAILRELIIKGGIEE